MAAVGEAVLAAGEWLFGASEVAGAGEAVSGAYAMTAAEAAAAGTTAVGVGESVSGAYAGLDAARTAAGAVAGGETLLNTAATNPALIDSAMGTTGYGASSAGPGGGLDFGQALGNLGQVFTNPGNLLEQFGVSPGVQKGLSYANNAYGLYSADQIRKNSDPFAKYRAGYGSQLAALEANSGSITTRPGYQAGLQAVQRGAAAGGYLGSGNEMAALAKYGGSFYEQEAARLAGLAGAGQAPGTGQVPAAMLAGQALAGFGYTPPAYQRRQPPPGG
jgi:hypothetical protein